MKVCPRNVQNEQTVVFEFQHVPGTDLDFTSFCEVLKKLGARANKADGGV